MNDECSTLSLDSQRNNAQKDFAMSLLESYENQLVESRVRLAGLVKQLVQSTNADNLGFFLIHHSGLGAVMTKSAAKWIRRAGKRCRTGQYSMLSDALIAQAKQEADCYRRKMNDTKALLGWWNKKRGLSLKARTYLRSSCASLARYQELQEVTMKGETPFGLLAIEFEIERASVVHGFILIKACVFKLGLWALRHLSFIRRHVKLGLGRSTLDKKMLASFLKEHPEALSDLVEKGKAALEAYGNYLQECFLLAEQDAGKYFGANYHEAILLKRDGD